MERDVPEIRIDFSLIFDNDISMEVITKEIGFFPTDCKDKKNQKKSLFKDDTLEGYWSIETDAIRTFFLEDVTKILINTIKPHLEKIKDAVEKYSGTVDFCIVSEFSSLDTPALCFDREFLDVVNFLNATIQFDIYVKESTKKETI